VTRTRYERDDRHVGGPDDVDFVLADADGLDDDDVEPGGVENDRRLGRRSRQPTEMAARCHTANEDAFVLGVRLHAHAVAENRAARIGAGRIDGNDTDRLAALAQLRGQSIDEGALARARRAGDADEIRAA